MRRLRRSAPDPAFAIGPWAPVLLLRLAIGVIGVVLAALVLQSGWLWVGIGLTLAAALLVRQGAAWALVVLLVGGELGRDPASVGGELLVLVAGVHLLAVLTLLARALPATGRLQLAALRGTAVRFVLVQVPAQVLALLALVLGGRPPALPIAAALGGGLLILLAAVLALQLVGPGPGARTAETE